MKVFFEKIKAQKKIVLFVALCAGIVSLAAIYLYRSVMVEPFTKETFTLQIYPDTPFEQVLDTISYYSDSSKMGLFQKKASYYKLAENMRPGSYRFTPNQSIAQVSRTLSRGWQTPVRVSFNNIRTVDQFAKRISDQLMLDSADIHALFQDTAQIAALGFTPETFPTLFLPDSYEFYWTVKPQQFLERMHQEYQRFWNTTRQLQLQDLGIDATQLAILASIAEEETNNAHERGVVGRLYLNRYHRKMLLQADPTVKFALQDFTLRRILFKHLEVDSPYNTYRYAGLPPGPIRIPSKQTLEAILHSKPHAYLYMCAKEDFSGLHNFAVTHREHQNNANKYRQALNRRGIR